MTCFVKYLKVKFISFKKILFLLRDLFFKILSPPFCENCRVFLAKREILCVTCMQKIMPVVAQNLKLSVDYKIPVYAIGAYTDPLKGLVLAKNRSHRLVSIFLAELIYDKTIFNKLPCDYLVPVPLHWTRTVKRGYNQSQVMAARLQELKPQICVADILKRTRATQYQTGLSKLDRAKNLKNAFMLKNIDFNLYQDKNLILIDDVFTSGATLIAAAQELRKLKPKTITIIVACRTVPK